MNQYCSNTTIDEVAQRILSARRVLLTTHAKPDGDGIGSALAMWRALRTKNIEADIFLMGPLEGRLRDIAGDTPYQLSDGRPPSGDYDLVVVLDTGSWSQLEILGDWLRDRYEQAICIDHHAKGDDVAAMRLVDATAASTTQILVGLIEAMGCELNGGAGGVAEALFVGLATDTGWFRYSSAGAEAMRVAARLLEVGVDKPRLYQIIEETARSQRLALQARALMSLEVFLDGSVALMMLRPQDFEATDGVVQDISELVNMPMSVRTIRVSVLLAQVSPGRTKLSFRSKPNGPGENGPAPVDMNLLAQRFGGGGHTHASGASVDLDIDEARAALVAVLEEERGPQGSLSGAGCRDTAGSR